jgi:flagellar basal body P-ring formation protein FlgA
MRLLLLFLLTIALPAWAGSFQSVESIRAAALSTLGADVEAEATLDPGLRMPLCPIALQAQPTGSNTVEVTCPQAAGWRLFVPLKVRRNQDVLVLKRGIGTGEIINLADISVERRDASRIAGAVLSDPATAVGKSVRRVLPAGTLLSASDLVSPRLVHRGDIVTLISRFDGLEVSMSGRALTDAGENDHVSVENSSSRRVVQGTVDAAGNVDVSR